MLSKKMQDALNIQVNDEMWSAYLYLAMSMDAADKGIKGAARWFETQYKEEMEHAFKIVGYLKDQMARVELKPIAEFPTNWDGCALKMFEKALENEKIVTGKIRDLYALANEENDIATQIFLQWFVTEQVEEEAQCQEAIDTLRTIGEDKAAFFLFDTQLGQRK